MAERDVMRGVYAGLSLIVVAAVFFTFLFVGINKETNKPDALLADWPSERIRAELGEADQVIDGTNFGLPAAFTCRIYINEGAQRYLVLCNP